MTDIPDELDGDQVLVVDGDVRRITKHEADERGRINIGTEYADETVRVAIIEVVEGDGDE